MHSEAGKRRVEDEFGVRKDLVEVIPHGAFDYLTRQPEETPLPPELAAVEGPVILAYGLIRPYKGTDILLEAFKQVEGAELWIAGMPHIDMEPLHVHGPPDMGLFGTVRAEAGGARRAAQAMQIPVHSGLRRDQIERVARVVRSVLEHA